ncbi:MAG TPA: hypothetical protein VFP80_03250 [Thermoanaerobaculia bacterium]|nr:hypothetical protein [Thermoanaerobaculia bacterium]
MIKQFFCFCLPAPNRFRAEKQAELQGHVESREAGRHIEVRSGDVVQAELATGNQRTDLLDPHLTRIGDFQR